MDIVFKSIGWHNPRVLVVESDVTDEAGRTISNIHYFPADTLEWRAAEYDIDPTDLDTLLDIVIYEPYMEDADRPDMLLHDATSVEEARTYHLSRIQKVKAKQPKDRVMSAAAVETHGRVREEIKKLSHMDPEVIQVKKNLVAKIRKDRKDARQMISKQMLTEDRMAPIRDALKLRTEKTSGSVNGNEER